MQLLGLYVVKYRIHGKHLWIVRVVACGRDFKKLSTAVVSHSRVDACHLALCRFNGGVVCGSPFRDRRSTGGCFLSSCLPPQPHKYRTRPRLASYHYRVCPVAIRRVAGNSARLHGSSIALSCVGIVAGVPGSCVGELRWSLEPVGLHNSFTISFLSIWLAPKFGGLGSRGIAICPRAPVMLKYDFVFSPPAAHGFGLTCCCSDGCGYVSCSRMFSWFPGMGSMTVGAACAVHVNC